MTGVQYKAYIWRDRLQYLVIAHAISVAHARDMAIEECRGSGDLSTPIRQQALKNVTENTPEIFYREVAEFVLTDSAELREAELQSFIRGKIIKDLRKVMNGLILACMDLSDPSLAIEEAKQILIKHELDYYREEEERKKK